MRVLSQNISQDQQSVLLASLYPTRIASTRLRLTVLAEPLRQSGFQVREWSFFFDSEIDAWLTGGGRRVLLILRALIRIKSFFAAIRGAGLVVIQRELLPLNTVVLEKSLLRKGLPFIWDLDDGLWQSETHLKSKIRGGSRKYRWLANNCSEVWAGNRTILNWIGSSKVPAFWVPTFVSLPDLDVCRKRNAEKDLLVWIGTPSTAPFIQKLVNDLGLYLSKWHLLVIGAQISAPKGVSVTCRTWSHGNESDALSRAWIGLYPLDPTHPLTAFKSSLKSILFRANGIPVVVTPTRSTLDTMTQGLGGVFAATPSDWICALEALRDPSFHSQQVEQAQKSVRGFTAEVWTPFLVSQIIKHVDLSKDANPDANTD